MSNRLRDTAVLDRHPNRSVVLGLIAAVAATALGSAISPDRPITATGVFARALAYIAFVFATAAVTTYLGLLLSGKERTAWAKEVAVRTATTALWLPPLLMFYGQRSWFVLVIWAVLAIEAASLIAFLRGTFRSPGMASSSTSEGLTFSVLKQDFPFGTSILGALLIQGAIFAAVGGHTFLAGLLYSLGTVTLAHRSFKMFRETAAASHRNFKKRTFTVLLATALLTIFAWLPYVFVPGASGGGGNASAGSGGIHPQAQGNGAGVHPEQQIAHGNSSSVLARLESLFGPQRSAVPGSSFAIAKRILDSSLSQESKGIGSRPRSTQNTNIATAVAVLGPVFPGVELYPELQPHTRLVAPPLTSTGGPGIARPDPLSIPFDGVYWFWRGPSDQPPLNSVLMHGSPSARSFRSTDGDGMSMEARQNLGFAVDPKRYGAIEVDIQNSDPFPNSVSILLKVRNTTIPGKPIQTLGMEKVATPALSADSGPRRQTLRFHIPSTITMGRFDELTVSYFLKGARSNRSARIAVERFRLVPRGG